MRYRTQTLALGAVLGVMIGLYVPQLTSAQTTATRISAIGKLTHLEFEVQTGLATSSTEFVNMSPQGQALVSEGITVENRGPLTATISLTVSGGPVDVRIPGLKPGVAHFDPSSGTTSFTYTWAGKTGKANCRTYIPEWRSTSGAEVTLAHATFVINHLRDNETKRGGKFSCAG